MKLQTFEQLEEKINKKFINVFDEVIEIKNVVRNDDIYVCWVKDGNYKDIELSRYKDLSQVFQEKEKEEYINIGDEITKGVYLVAIEDVNRNGVEATINCIALCVNSSVKFRSGELMTEYAFNRYKDFAALKWVVGKGVPKSEIQKIYN